MFSNAILFNCPFCPEPEGLVFVDTEACLDQRSEDPDPVYFHEGSLDDPQDLLRFGCNTGRRCPCKHMIFVRGVIEWYGHPPTTEWEDETLQWSADFDWTPPALRMLDRGVGAMILGNPEILADLGAASVPPVEVHYDRPVHRWDALASFKSRASIYSADMVFVAASHPLRLRAALAGHIKAIKRHVKKLKEQAEQNG